MLSNIAQHLRETKAFSHLRRRLFEIAVTGENAKRLTMRQEPLAQGLLLVPTEMFCGAEQVKNEPVLLKTTKTTKNNQLLPI